MGEGEGSVGGDGGARGALSPVGGSKGPEPLASPKCMTLGRLAPRHCAVRRRPRCPRLARRAAREGCRWRDGWPRPNCDHAPKPHGRAVRCRGRPFRIPHRRRDLRSLRGESVQDAFRGGLHARDENVQPARQSWRIQGGQDTIERHAGRDAVMEKTVQREQENPGLNERGMIDDYRLRGSRTWRQRGRHLFEGGVSV